MEGVLEGNIRKIGREPQKKIPNSSYKVNKIKPQAARAKMKVPRADSTAHR